MRSLFARFTGTFVWTFSSVAVRALGSLLINKIFAIHFGGGGITLLAHFQNLAGMITGIPGEGINQGMIRYLSGRELAAEEKRAVFAAALLLNLLVFCMTCTVLLLAPASLTAKFRGGFAASQWLLLFVVPLLFNLLNLLCIALLNGTQQFRKYAVMSATAIVCSTALIGVSISYGNVFFSLLAYGFGQGLAFVLSCMASWRLLLSYLPDRQLMLQLKPALHRLRGYLGLGITMVVLNRANSYLVREYAIHQFGLLQTGWWEAALRVSDSYTMVFTSAFLVVFYPRVSSLLSSPAELKAYLVQVVRIVLPAILLGLILIVVSREHILQLLFNREFTRSATLLGFLAAGDFFKFISYMLANLLLAQAMNRRFMILQVFLVLMYFLLTYVCTQYWQLEGMAIAFLLSYLFSVIILISANRKLFYLLFTLNRAPNA